MAVLGVESALYSILTYMSAARTLDFIIHGIEEYTAITIMSDHNEFIRRRITGELGRGVTVYRARGGMTGDEREILYCVVTRLESGGSTRSSAKSMTARLRHHCSRWPMSRGARSASGSMH